jgi:hypothetical protein
VYIASDELEGRDTPSPSLEKAAEYIVSNLKRWGVEPAGDKGTYFQSVPMVTYRRDSQKTKAQLNSRELVLGKDFTTPENPDLTGSASGRFSLRRTWLDR